MSDTPEPTPKAPPKETYRLCQACGSLIPHSAAHCPECGAYPGEEEPPVPVHTRSIAGFSVMLACFLAALLLLMQNHNLQASPQADLANRLAPADPALLPTPTPTPLPPPPPTPVPEPTPVPPPPTATPVPQVIAPPEPTPVPPPPPTPIPRRTRTQELREEVVAEFTMRLDQNFPMHRQGDVVRLVLVDGQVVNGTLVQIAPGQLLLRMQRGDNWLAFRQLSQESRIRVDPSERSAFIEERALEEVLRRLQQDGNP